VTEHYRTSPKTPEYTLNTEKVITYVYVHSFNNQVYNMYIISAYQRTCSFLSSGNYLERHGNYRTPGLHMFWQASILTTSVYRC